MPLMQLVTPSMIRQLLRNLRRCCVSYPFFLAAALVPGRRSIFEVDFSFHMSKIGRLILPRFGQVFICSLVFLLRLLNITGPFTSFRTHRALDYAVINRK